jgi:hypothetical protein
MGLTQKEVSHKYGLSVFTIRGFDTYGREEKLNPGLIDDIRKEFIEILLLTMHGTLIFKKL